MTVAEFKRLMDMGLGRAVLYLQSHPAMPYRDVILHGCLHVTAYDFQSEGVRGDYLFDLVQATGEASFYRDKVLAALSEGNFESEGDEAWCFDLAKVFAQHGDTDAREVMYARFTHNVSQSDSTTGAEALIALDGTDGFLYVADALGGAPLYNPDLWGYTQHWIALLEARDGEAQSRAWLEMARLSNPHVDALLQAQAERQTELPTRASTFVGLPYSELKAHLLEQRGRASFRALARWGTKASHADFEQAAHDFIRERDAALLIAYLSIFAERAFPLEPHRLVTLVAEAEGRVAWLAAGALAKLQHPSVREVALRLLERGERQKEGVRLLCSVFQAEDRFIIERVLRGTLDNESLHAIGSEIRNLFKAHPSADNVDILLLLYEKGPCSMCREAYVEMLLALDALPPEIRAECRYDSSLASRALVG